MTQMMRALNFTFAGQNIEQFQMGFCAEGCNVLKQRWWCVVCVVVYVMYAVVVYVMYVIVCAVVYVVVYVF